MLKRVSPWCDTKSSFGATCSGGYLLPLALGIEAAVLAFTWTLGVHWLVHPIAFACLGILVIITLGGWWFSRWYLHTYYEPRRQELEALVRELKSQ